MTVDWTGPGLLASWQKPPPVYSVFGRAKVPSQLAQTPIFSWLILPLRQISRLVIWRPITLRLWELPHMVVFFRRGCVEFALPGRVNCRLSRAMAFGLWL